MANLNAWAATVAGRYIDVDKWEGNQCWDLSQHWLTTCNGGTLWTQPSRFPGLAAGSWEVATGNTANTADLLRHVTAHPGTERGLPGDIVIFAYGSPAYPISHTAVLIEDRGPILRTLSQNSSPARPDLPGYSDKSSGPTIYQDLTRAGILGFLRPRATITGQGSNITPINPSKEDDVSASEVLSWPVERTDGQESTVIVELAKIGPDNQALQRAISDLSATIKELPAKVAEATMTHPVKLVTGQDSNLLTELATLRPDVWSALRAISSIKLTGNVSVDALAIAKAVNDDAAKRMTS